MNLRVQATSLIEQLLAFAVSKQLIEPLDIPYYRNLLLDTLHMDAPAAMASPMPDTLPSTATPLLHALCDIAVACGILEDMQYARDLFSARLMGVLTPSPKEVRDTFQHLLQSQSPQAATQYFYQLCRACDYIKVDAIAQNIRYFADSPAGELEITINLSKPEKDPKEIARLKNAPSVGYPKCMLCVENPGYAGNAHFPARQNHRIVPMRLAGADWYLQYSPYAYYPEHCIVFNSHHVNMKVDRGTFERLFSFVDQMPHYFLGSNADLPIVGGSILNHDHFQGGHYTFPMDRAGIRCALHTPYPAVHAGIVDWPMAAIRLTGTEPAPLIGEAERILNAWRAWSDESCDILAQTEDTPHNTITPILRRTEQGYCLTLVLRNNRTSQEHPLGIFHPHAPLHHIKKENIGLIEVMGLFILPGRLKTELALLEDYLIGEKTMVRPASDDPCAKHFDWLQEIVSAHGLCATRQDAQVLLRTEVARVCAQVLADAGVYKQDEAGLQGMLRFLSTLGYHS